MRLLLERIRFKGCGAELLEGKSGLEKFKEKHGIVNLGKTWPYNSVGFSEKERKCYGWSHRAILGFGIGDKIFEPDFGDENTLFTKHGSKTIKNMDDAKESAKAFAKYMS